MTTPEQHAQEALTRAIPGVMAAGELLSSYFRSSLEVHMKAPDHPVTQADIAANELLEERLRPLYPDFGWLSEETPDSPDRLQREWLWVVDPLDGTRDFMRGSEDFVVSVGLAFQGRAIGGLLLNPVRGELFRGVVGLCATFNGRACEVSRGVKLAHARVLCSRNDLRLGRIRAWEEAGLNLISMGSTAYKLGLVAAGLADACFTPRPRSEWDLCGGVAIVEAAGGLCGDGDGRAFVFNGITTETVGLCAANAEIHALLMRFFGTGPVEGACGGR